MSFTGKQDNEMLGKRVVEKVESDHSLADRNTAKPAPMSRGKWDDETDIVVIGYGGAGSCEAIAAHDAGASVLILEKAPVNGGNTGVSGGSLSVPSEITNAVEYYRALTWGTVDEESIHALAKAMFELPHKLEEWGAKLE
jgi:succinate dehydrogenase/fumarate reductase flavoprotein subunit